MSVKITYFVHGTTTDNERHLSSGWNDVELSELGKKQSKELAYLTIDKHFDVVFCSDLKRAVDSANIAWGDKYTIIQDARLRECNYGDYNAKPSDFVEPLQEQSITTPMPNGESYEMVKDRIASFLSDLKRDYNGKHVAIVGHKAPQLALDVLLKRMTWEEAFATDWRKTKSWQDGWEYTLYNKVSVADENDNLIGAEYMIDAIRKGLIRRASRVYVFNTKGQLLVQQRSERVLKPLMLDQSAAGHVDEGETYEQAAYRELKEELGIDGVTLELVATSFRTSDFYNAIYKAKITDHTEIDFDPEELKQVIWYNISDLDKEMKESPDKFTPAFKEVWSMLRDKLIEHENK